MYKFYIEGTLLRNQPIGWDEFVETIERDDMSRGIVMRYESNLTFWGDGYTIIQTNYLANGYCPTLTFVIEKKENNSPIYTKIFDGLIFLTDSVTNLNKLTIECQIEDNSYFAKINNNKSIKAKLTIGKSKNGISITPCPSLNIDFFSPSTGLYSGVTRKCFDIVEVFTFLVSFMTDGEIGFVSDFLSNLPNDEKLSILSGYELRIYNGSSVPIISYEETFTEVNKKYNIGFVIEIISGQTVLRIENYDYFFNQTPIITINYIEDLKRSFDNSKLYSNINVGFNKNAAYDSSASPQIHSLPIIRYRGFLEENYIIQGKCNIDKALDLLSDWIADSNLIEYQANDTTYDRDTFFLQYTLSTLRATKGFYWTDALPLYNEQLLNSNVIDRWGMQGDVASYLSNDETFAAFYTSSSATFTLSNTNGTETISGIQFNDDYSTGYDTSNNYGNGTTQGSSVSQPNSIFTAPFNDIFNFSTNIHLGVQSFGWLFPGPHNLASSFFLRVNLHRYNSSNVLIETKSGHDEICLVDEVTFSYSVADNFTFYMNTGDYIVVDLFAQLYIFTDQFTITMAYDSGTFFKCISTSLSGYVFKENDSDNYLVNLFDFKKGLSQDDWEIIKSNPKGAIQFNNDGITQRLGWIKKIPRNTTTSEANFELITNVTNGN